MNNRRKLLIALGAAPFAPQTLFAQAKDHPVLIGWLTVFSRKSGPRLIAALKEGLAALGWKDGSQIVIEERWADGQLDRVAPLVQELVLQKPALIVALGLRVAQHAAKVAPKVPIVMISGTDPVAAGLVASLARPGGMITGLAGFNVELVEKHLELLVLAAPKVKRVAFLSAFDSLNNPRYMKAARRAAAHYAVEAHFAEVARAEEIEPAILQLAKEGAQGLVVLPAALFGPEGPRIMKFALMQRWPVVAGSLAWARRGALLSYGADFVASHRRAAYFVDRILNGANPGDIPMEQPTTFEFVVNLKTANALGLTMPPEIMVQATRVIQ